MGLDTTHGAWNGPYSSFMNWRVWLAKKQGFNLKDMEGFGGSNEWTEEMQGADYYPLLNHSDCDGELTPLECFRTVQFLAITLENKPNDKDLDLESKQQYERCERFMKGCQKAITQQESIEFH